MTEIVVHRGGQDFNFKSWKRYAKALEAEVKTLHQLVPSHTVEAGFRAFKKEASLNSDKEVSA